MPELMEAQLILGKYKSKLNRVGRKYTNSEK